jgi:hypothetical protein
MDKPKEVDAQHKDYAANAELLGKYTAVMGGSKGVREGATKYLPKYPAETADDYAARLRGATIDGVVMEGVEGLTGKVFHEDPDLSAVKIDAAILENIDNKGNKFAVFARDSFKAGFDGSSVIIVDAPKLDDGETVQSLEDERNKGIRPYWRLYRAKDATNWMWDTDPQTKKTKLVLLVLRECREVPDGPFGVKEVEYFRVYRDTNGIITQELWRKKQQGEDERFNGQNFIMEWRIAMPKLKAIPAAIIGELGSKPWVANEAELEIKGYQKESSYDSIEYLSLPIPVFKGRPADMIGKPMPYGPSVAADISVEGDAFYMQIDAGGLTVLKATIDGIKQEIAGKLDALSQETMPQGDAQTATEVVSDDSKSQARLIVWAQQAEDAFNRALQFTGQFMGMGEDAAGVVELRPAWKVLKEEAVLQKEKDAEIVMKEQSREDARVEIEKAKAGQKK